MAYNAKCIFFFVLTLCLSLQIHARDSKFFNKLSKQNHESISISPVISPTLAPSPSPEAEEVEHGYGLYGQDPFESYQYPPTTKNPTKFSGEKYVSAEDVSNLNNFQENGKGNEKGNGINEKQGMSDTRFLENGKYYYDPNQDVKDESSTYFRNNGNGNGNENRYEAEREGMSDTRFLENGKYFHDINNEEKNGHFNAYNFENENFEGVGENNGHFNTNNFENENFEGVKEENNYNHFNTNNYENENEEDFEDEKDTRYLENGKYYYDVNEEAPKEGKVGRFEVRNNGNGNENHNFEMEKHGMSDTRFMENGKYYYDVNDEQRNNNYNHENNNNNNNNNNKFGVEDVGFHSNNNVEFANAYNGNGYENEYETEGRGRHNYHPNEYHVKEERGGYNGVKPKKYVYDTMEEYDREQGYIDGQDHYIP